MAEDDKANGSGPENRTERPELSEQEKAMLRRAEAVISNLAETYPDVAARDVERLETAVEALEADPPGYAKHLARIFEISHDMKGQGASFGYPMITEVGNLLCRFVERLDGPPDEEQMMVVKIHVGTLRVVVTDGIRTTEGEVAETLLGGLQLVNRKVSE